MYSTAPAPHIGDYIRPPLVSRDTGRGLPGFNLLTRFHSYIRRKYSFAGGKTLLIAPYAIWLHFPTTYKHQNAYLAFYLESLLKILA